MSTTSSRGNLPTFRIDIHHGYRHEATDEFYLPLTKLLLALMRFEAELREAKMSTVGVSTVRRALEGLQ